MVTVVLRAVLFAAMVSGAMGTTSAPTQNPHGPPDMACENCHTAQAWMPIRDHPEFDHNKTRYPLRGMHVRVPCQECHVDRIFRRIGGNCADCHADIHRRKNGARCDVCHRVNGWQVSVHSINEHQNRFPLIGAHASVDCYSCHKIGAAGQLNRQGLSTACVSCHLRSFLKTTAPNHQALGLSMDCLQCHTTMDNWFIAARSRTKLRK